MTTPEATTKTINASRNILVTGGHGFLGRNLVQYFSKNGFNVYGIGRGYFTETELQSIGLTQWIEADISQYNLEKFEVCFDYILHCAGGASVTTSIDNPAFDFNNTVNATLETLEFIRKKSPSCKLIYPSSAAVYGEHDNSSIAVSSPVNPASPYGFHKRMAEELCISYNKFFDVGITIIRFFSIYGPGLKKQLIWDACNKMQSASESVSFWGTGNETRDWIYISDAVELINACMNTPNCPLIINGGSGAGITIKETLSLLLEILKLDDLEIKFNGQTRSGDPLHYQAELSEHKILNWKPETSLSEGLNQYSIWFKANEND
jgi:UDP-glucose 4-epimerase